MERARNRKKGFLLVESLTAIFLLASLILFSISSFIVGRYITKLSKERFIVSNLLRQEMETILAGNYSIIADGSVETPITIVDGTSTFNAVKTVDSETKEPGMYGYKEIYAKIEWTGGISRSAPLVEEMVMYVTKQ
jgi:hypothetical protein